MKSIKVTVPKTLNLFICYFPLFFVLGNFFLNSIVVLVSVLGIIHYKKELINFKKDNPVLLIIFFFIIVFFSSFLEYFQNNQTAFLLKSFTFLRYLIFLLVLRCMMIKNDLDLKKVLFLSLFFSSFIALDVIFQYFAGFNIFGFKPYLEVFPASLFVDEPIAGGYILRFATIGFFALPWLFDEKNNKFFYISFLLLAISFAGTILSNNRMPTLMFVIFLSLLIIFFILRNLNYIKITSTIVVILISFLFVINSEYAKKRYVSFYGGIPNLSKIINEVKKDYPEFKKYENSGEFFWFTETYKKNKDKINTLPSRTGHDQIYITSLDAFLDDPLLGRGIKSFRYTCQEKKHLPNRMCENHPHHFYLEILNDVGIVGFITIFSAVILLIIKNLKKFSKRNKKINKIYSMVFYSFLFALLIEYFPLRSQGSYSTVWNISYICFILGILCGLADLKPERNLRSFKQSSYK